MSIFFRPGRTDLNHIFLHKYTLHKRYKSQLKTFAVEVASFQIESHSSLERTPPRSAAPRFVCSEKHNVHVHFDEIFSSEIFPASFFFQLIQWLGPFLNPKTIFSVITMCIFFSEFLSSCPKKRN